MRYGGPKGVNWEKALEYYLTPSDEGKMPSYQDVANQFGVSKKEVGLRAKRENWVQRRQNVYDLAEEEFVEDRVALINETVQKHIEQWQELQEMANEYLAIINGKVKNRKATYQTIKDLNRITSIFKVAIEGERTALGLPNSIHKSNQPIHREVVKLTPEMIAEMDKFFETYAAQSN